MRTRAKIDDAILAKDIKDLSEKIGRIPRQDDYKKGGAFGLNTLLLRKPWNQWLTEIFGQINADRERKTEKVLDIDIMNDIKRVGTLLGKSPTQREYDQKGTVSLSMVLRRKKWNEWLESSLGSVNYNRANDSKTKRIDDLELVDDVQRVATELGHTPTRGEYDEFGYFSSDTIVARKPWVEFIQKVCGLEPSKVVPINREKATDEELLEQLKTLVRTLGRTPLKSDLGGENGFGWSAYERAFGTFGNALVAAGLIDSLNRYCVPREELIAELKRVYVLLGHTPSENEFLANSPIRSNGSIYSEFGSWTQGLLAAGIPVTKAQHVSIDEIKTALQKWYVENNDDNSCLEYWKLRKAKKNRRFPYSCVTISAKFHPMTWEEIMHECGFSNYVTKDHYISGRKRGNHTGLDGNEYLSSLEKEVGNFLFELKNSGNLQNYEYEAKVCSDKAWTCDFKVTFPDGRILWLEADGLRKNRHSPYASGKNEKIQFYIDNDKDFAIISYSSSDIRNAVRKSLSL
jgi:hypothetical protein